MSRRRHICPHCGHDHTTFFERILEVFNRPTNVNQGRSGAGRCGKCNGRIEYEIADLERKDDEILRLEREIVVGMSATGFSLHTLRGVPGTGDCSMIDPTKDIIAVGTTRWLQWSTLPIGSKLKPGAPVVVTTGDKSIAIAQGSSPDGDPTKFSVTVDPAEALPTFGLTISGTSLDGTPISSTFTLPLGPASSTGGNPALGFDLSLLASAPVAPGGGGTGPTAPTLITTTPSSINGTVGDTPTALKVVDDQGNDVTASSTYASADPTIATVDATGLITLVGPGTTSINVTNGSLTTSVAVTSAAVAAPAAPSSPAV